MKLNRETISTIFLLIIISALYRVMPNRPLGFAPQIAMALFAGSILMNKKTSFIVPLLSMFISDIFYQILYLNGFSNIPGFYDGQVINYALFASITAIGFSMKQNISSILNTSFLGALFYFITSNLMVWLTSGMYQHNLSGLLDCYYMAIPFFTGSLCATVVFNLILLTGYKVSKYDFAIK